MSFSRVFIMSLLVVALISVFMGGCATQKPLTPEQQQMAAAKKDCLNRTASMFNDAPNPNDANENDYFTMCMETRYGYSWEQVRQMPF